MKPLPIAEWLRSLGRIETSLADTLNEVERHEHDVADLLNEPEPAASLDTAVAMLGTLDERLAEHDRRLASAAELTEQFDEWLTEQESNVTRWQGAFSRWRERIQQSPSGPPANTTQF